MKPRSTSRVGALIPIGASLALGVLVVILSFQNAALKRRLTSPRPRQPAPAPTGDRTLPPLFIVNENNEPEVLPALERTLILASSTACHACPEVADAWTTLRSLADDRGIRTVAFQVQMSSATGELAPAPDIGPLCTFVGPIQSLAEAAPGFPATLIVDDKGNIVEALIGTPDADALTRLINALQDG